MERRILILLYMCCAYSCMSIWYTGAFHCLSDEASWVGCLHLPFMTHSKYQDEELTMMFYLGVMPQYFKCMIYGSACRASGEPVPCICLPYRGPTHTIRRTWYIIHLKYRGLTNQGCKTSYHGGRMGLTGVTRPTHVIILTY